MVIRVEACRRSGLHAELAVISSLAVDALQGSPMMLLDPVAQSLLNTPQATGRCRLAPPRLNKSRRPLLELKHVTSPLRLRHLRYPFASEQLAKGHVLQG